MWLIRSLSPFGPYSAAKATKALAGAAYQAASDSIRRDGNVIKRRTETLPKLAVIGSRR